jgi:HAD superfamily hydrolase (TIGR01509 family)
MPLTTAIFDMDGLLIDSEPLWHEAFLEALSEWNVNMSESEYANSVGLRTREFLQHWLPHFGLGLELVPEVDAEITRLVKEKISARGQLLPGVPETLEMVRRQGLRVGLASSSPLSVIRTTLDRSGLHDAFDYIASAEELPFAKPHPQVYLDCAAGLGARPVDCLCFEDSFNGLIAAKSARMRCVIVPAPHVYTDAKWGAADLILPTLEGFTDEVLGHFLRLP